MASKRKASAMAASAAEEPVDPSDELMFLCLGGGNEVGRSCHIVQYKGKTVMLDAGQHPAYDGLAGLPFFDDFDLSTVDVLLISHRDNFHVDHAASLPYVLAKTNFRGRVFMTHATKAIYKWLIQDSVRVGNTSSNPTAQPVYTEQDHLNTFPQIEAIDFHTTHTISNIRITPYPAGHVLGAAMFLIEIAGLNIFFTGDYSREPDRHLVSAEVPKGVKVDVLITESTYGVATHVPRLEREQALMKSVTGILNRGGRALLPVFALGRAQELLLILDEYWEKHPEYQKIPIYFASNLARKCMLVYQTYIGAMNDSIKRMYRERMAEAEKSGSTTMVKRGPWDFKFIRSLKSLDRFDDVGSCVMLASPGMLQNGVSRELLERWAPSDKNGVIITGYSVEGTMAKQIMQEPDHIQAVMSRHVAGARRAPGADSDKILIPRRCSIAEYSFAAHVDGTENREFIEEVAAPVVILVHGEQHNMMRLKSKLLSLNATKANGAKVYSPRNCEELRIPFKADRTAKVVGKLASLPPPKSLPDPSLPNKELKTNHEEQPEVIVGVLVQNDFKLSLMAPEDLQEYAGLTTTVVICKQHYKLSRATVELIKWGLEGAFGTIEPLPPPVKEEPGESDDTKVEDEQADPEDKQLLEGWLIMGCISLCYFASGRIGLEWEGNMLNDSIADAVIGLIMNIETSPAAVKYSASTNPYSHCHIPPHPLPGKNPHARISPEDRLERLFMFLEAQFGAENIAPITEPKLPPEPELVDDNDNNDSDSNSQSASTSPRDSSTDAESTTKPLPSSADDASPPPTKTEDSQSRLQARQAAELARLHGIGIPVPGVSIQVDKMRADVWLEDLEVECANKVFADRVRAVVERAVETIAPLWA